MQHKYRIRWNVANGVTFTYECIAATEKEAKMVAKRHYGQMMPARLVYWKAERVQVEDLGEYVDPNEVIVEEDEED